MVSGTRKTVRTSGKQKRNGQSNNKKKHFASSAYAIGCKQCDYRNFQSYFQGSVRQQKGSINMAQSHCLLSSFLYLPLDSTQQRVMMQNIDSHIQKLDLGFGISSFSIFPHLRLEVLYTEI